MKKALALVLALCMYLYLRYTKHGYEIAVIGESESTAKYVGINVKKAIIRTMLLSGAICGIAGFITVAGKNMPAEPVTVKVTFVKTA